MTSPLLKPGFTAGGWLPDVLPKNVIQLSHENFSEDEKWMKRALCYAMQSVGITNPNPAVGCVIVKDGKLISFGATEEYKKRHAERVAFDKVTDKNLLKGSTVYVTLEPCSHKGHQPPCAELFVNSGVERVVIGAKDPNPLVAGNGIKKVCDLNISATVGVLEEEIKSWLAPFLHHHTKKNIFVAAKWAQSVEGVLADINNESKWISNEYSRLYVHWLRQKYDLICVGSLTFIRDLPLLTVRGDHFPILRQPLRVVWDPYCLIAENHLMNRPEFKNYLEQFSYAHPWVWIADPHRFAKDSLLANYVQQRKIILLPYTENKSFKEYFEDKIVFDLLGKTPQSILVEGGATLLNLLFKENQINAAHIFKGTKSLGNSPHKVVLPQDQTIKTQTQIAGDELVELNFG